MLFVAGKKTLEWFGVGNARRSTAAVLSIDPGGIVSVSVDGGAMKRAETDVKLYAGDSVVTSPRNTAQVDLFDGTSIRMDESTQLNIIKSFEGQEQSTLSVELPEGGVWLATPKLSSFSGAITRIISTPYISATIPSQSEIVITPRSLAVFAADGLGLPVTIAENGQSIIIGEGQQFTLPPGGEQEADLYVYRNPLDAQQMLSEFVEQSRARYGSIQKPGTSTTVGNTAIADGVILEVTAPDEGSTIDTATLEVKGRIGSDVEKVRINGYLADVNVAAQTFNEELALPEEDDINITIEAIDSNGVVIAESLRSVHRDRKPPEAPTILSPATNGQTYMTNQQELAIAGKAPEGAVGIIVNDYRLQLFEPGDTDWSYLANTKYDNMHIGTNVYEVVAINRGGYRSDVATITIILNPDAEPGVLPDSTPQPDSVTPTPTTQEESNLPKNAPTNPGSIVITAPASGTEYTTKNVENLIEGTVPTQTYSVWVNGYRLRLYEPGKTFFNYIASVELNTLKRGRNPYRITIRAEDGSIIDELTYVLNFQP